MTTREAEQTLSTIRTLMERSTRYTNLSGHAGIAAGVLTLVGCLLRMELKTPFFPTWLGVLVAACCANVYFTAEMARANGEPLWTRQAKTALLALTPSFLAALVLTVVLERAGQRALLPGIWMLLWGCGTLALSFFTPRVISLLGATFMGAGSVTLLLPPGSDAVAMGLTFGAIHLVYGVVLTAGRHRAFAGKRLAIDA